MRQSQRCQFCLWDDWRPPQARVLSRCSTGLTDALTPASSAQTQQRFLICLLALKRVGSGPALRANPSSSYDGQRCAPRLLSKTLRHSNPDTSLKMLAWPFGLARQQIASYAPLKGIVAAGDASAIHPPNPPLRCWPSIADVLSSRKVRVWLPFSLLALTVFVLGHPYDALPAIRTGVSKGEENNNGQQPPAAAPGWDSNSNAPPDIADAVDWSRFAYVQYVTDSHYLCNSVMLFERLQQLGSRADRVLMYPSRMLDPTVADGGASNDARLLIKARDEYNAKLVPIEVHHREVGEDSTLPSRHPGVPFPVVHLC
jgi:hypothetical protein